MADTSFLFGTIFHCLYEMGIVYFRQEMTKVNEFKKENIQSVRECFYEGTPLTKEALNKRTNLSNASLVNILSYLLNNKEIIQVDDAKSTGGRKKKQYVLNSNYAHIAKVLLHKIKKEYFIEIYICNLKDEIIQKDSIHSSKGTIKEFIKVLDTYINKRIKLICISIPGICKDGIIHECDFKEFENYDLGKHIKQKYKIPYVIENDVNVAIIGLSKRHKDIEDMVLIYQPVEDYFGCGILINGKLYNGYSHAAGELRFLPDKTLSEQKQETKKHPKEFLTNRVKIIKAVLDPEIIFVGSDVCDVSNMKNVIPINNIEEIILEGLFNIGLHNLGGKEYVR